MVFSTNIFLFFFLPVSVLGYYILDKKFKNIFLILLSLFFYAWGDISNLKYIIIFSLANYVLSFVLLKLHKKIILGIVILFNVSFLVFFKYIIYILSIFNTAFSLQLPILDQTVPLGISFIIFHMISYHVDCYKNKDLFTKNIFDFALYILFFPKLLQGPIVKFKDFTNQKAQFDLNQIVTGLERLIIGLAKKVIIADTLLSCVTKSIGYWQSFGIDQFTYWIIIICYIFVIYFDFSAYSDMAIGLAKIFGFSIKENFNFPYISTSITEFWRRWHISLGEWFKEYVYIPLGGNRKGNVYLHLLAVFLLTGIWHGAGVLFFKAAI